MHAFGRIALIAVSVAEAACYRPSITSGGFLCAAGGACPEGFRCNADKRCYAGDGGPEVVTCTDPFPSVPPVCTELAPSGSDCNPACQYGCPCGRCTIVGSKASCAAVGTKKEGEGCNLAGDDCGVGFGCVKDMCGTLVGRCRKFCRNNGECTIGCNPLAGTPSVSACDPPPQTCDPLSGSGCPDPALGCFLVTAKSTICDCPGHATEGSPCLFPSDCLPGVRCLGVMGVTSCHKVCTGSQDCSAGQVCTFEDDAGAFGFCAAP